MCTADPTEDFQMLQPSPGGVGTKLIKGSVVDDFGQTRISASDAFRFLGGAIGGNHQLATLIG